MLWGVGGLAPNRSGLVSFTWENTRDDAPRVLCQLLPAISVAELNARNPAWKVNERKVQKVMRNNGMLVI